MTIRLNNFITFIFTNNKKYGRYAEAHHGRPHD